LVYTAAKRALQKRKETNMFCSSCGTNNPDGTAFCSKCGTPVARMSQPTPAPVFSAPRPSSPGSTFSTIGIICGVVAFLFFPIVFGPAGLILGAVAKSKGEEKAVVALVVSGLGLVVGMFLGFVVFANM
jgi:hypothetical protein